jgi:hypothetical protein
MTDQNSITALLAVLYLRVLEASRMIEQAHAAAAAGEMNLAIGTLMPAEPNIEDAVSLLRVVLSLHRGARNSAGAR